MKKYLKYVIVLFILSGIIWTFLRNNNLKTYNKVTTGYIYKKSSYRRHHRCQFYFFHVNGIRYEGSTNIDPEYDIGDSLLIRYYPIDPNINKTEKDFQNL